MDRSQDPIVHRGMVTEVCETSSGERYVEVDGVRYGSDELPSVGTEVEVDTYTGDR